MLLYDVVCLVSVLFVVFVFGFIVCVVCVVSWMENWFDLCVFGLVVLSVGMFVVIKYVYDMMMDVVLFVGMVMGFCGLFEFVM